MNSFDIPITAGYVPYRNPYFGLFLYGGLVVVRPCWATTTWVAADEGLESMPSLGRFCVDGYRAAVRPSRVNTCASSW